MRNMVDIKLNHGQTGYDAVEEYVKRYWKYNGTDIVVFSIGVSYDGRNYNLMKELASPCDTGDVEFFYDWWEGEKYIKLFGIKAINKFNIVGGIYQ